MTPLLTITTTPDGTFWELVLPANILPANITSVTLSPAGIYIELQNGRWDLVPFAELADLVDTADARQLAPNPPAHNGRPATRPTILGIPIVGVVKGDAILGNRIDFTN